MKLLILATAFLSFSCLNSSGGGGGRETTPTTDTTPEVVLPGGLDNASFTALSFPEGGRLIADINYVHNAVDTSVSSSIDAYYVKLDQEAGVYDYIGFELEAAGPDTYNLNEVAILDGVTVETEFLGQHMEDTMSQNNLITDIATACLDGNLAADYRYFQDTGLDGPDGNNIGGVQPKGGSYNVYGQCNETDGGVLAEPEIVECVLVHRDESDRKYIAFIAPSDNPDGCDFFIHRDHLALNPLVMDNLDDLGVTSGLSGSLDVFPQFDRFNQFQ